MNRNTLELISNISNMDKLASKFKLVHLVNPSPKLYRKYVKLEVASPNQPKPELKCASCLYQLGFGYDRISRCLIVVTKNNVYNWICRRKKAGQLKRTSLARNYWIKRPAKPVPENIIKIRKKTYIPKYTKEQRLELSLANKTQRKIKSRLRSYFSQWHNHGLYPKLMSLLVGCDLYQFKHWIYSQFKKGMTWENHGTYWDIDHIVPCRAFDLTDRKQAQKCFHFSNLRPLKKKDNNSKRDRIIECQPELVLNMKSSR